MLQSRLIEVRDTGETSSNRWWMPFIAIGGAFTAPGRGWARSRATPIATRRIRQLTGWGGLKEVAKGFEMDAGCAPSGKTRPTFSLAFHRHRRWAEGEHTPTTNYKYISDDDAGTRFTAKRVTD